MSNPYTACTRTRDRTRAVYGDCRAQRAHAVHGFDVSAGRACTDAYTAYTRQTVHVSPSAFRQGERVVMINKERELKIYRQHRCTRKHRTYSAFMRCAIPNCEWVAGEGPFAVIAWCRTPTITLWQALDSAKRQPVVNGDACGGQCVHRHEIIRISLEHLESS